MATHKGEQECGHGGGEEVARRLLPEIQPGEAQAGVHCEDTKPVQREGGRFDAGNTHQVRLDGLDGILNGGGVVVGWGNLDEVWSV